MCDVTYAMLAISAIGTAVQYDSERKAANAQRDMFRDGIGQEQAATNRAYEQINDSAKDEQAQRRTDYLIDKARIMAIQAESGLSGANYERAIQQVEDNADTDMATIERNRQRQLDNAESQAAAKANQARVQMSGIRQPSAIGSGLQIADYGMRAKRHYDDPNAKVL
jgi:hypothetical protein